MAVVNFPGPLVAKTIYTHQSFTHVNHLNLNGARGQGVGGAPADYELINKDASTQTFNAWALLYQAKMVPLMSASPLSQIARIELWEYPEDSESGTFLTQFFPTTTAGDGTSAVDPSIAGQATISFRTEEGGIAKWVGMEMSFATQVVNDQFPFSDSRVTDMATFLTANTSPVLGKDTSPLIGAIAFYTTQNKKLFKARYR